MAAFTAGISRRLCRRTEMSERTHRLTQAFAALDRGDINVFRDLFAEEARWLGIPDRGWGGETPT
jgi:ketosteroid isomerase-like protein